MRISRPVNSFRARLLLLLVVLLGLTLYVQYKVNVRSVRSNAQLIVEQERAIMAGVALGVNSINSGKYLDEIGAFCANPLLDEKTGRVKNVLVVDNEGRVQEACLENTRLRKTKIRASATLR